MRRRRSYIKLMHTCTPLHLPQALTCSMRLVRSPASGCPSKFMKRSAGTCGGCRASTAGRLKAGPPAIRVGHGEIELIAWYSIAQQLHSACIPHQLGQAADQHQAALAISPPSPGCSSSSGSRCSNQCMPSALACRSASCSPYLAGRIGPSTMAEDFACCVNDNGEVDGYHSTATICHY